MSNKNEQFLLIMKHYWVPTCAGDIKKEHKASSLRFLRLPQPGEGKGEAFVQKASYVAAGCSISTVSNVDNMCCQGQGIPTGHGDCGGRSSDLFYFEPRYSQFKRGKNNLVLVKVETKLEK